jgi:Na+-translocating ferredoxin:NAD+ oxidoreductase RnfA subunit
MAVTFTVCSWLLWALAIGVTGWRCPHPLMFGPFILLAFAISAARRLSIRAVVFVLTLASVCVFFWSFRYLDDTPLVFALVQSFVAALTALVVRRIETNRW